MCFQQQQLHTTAETVESEHSLNCKIHNTWMHQTTEIESEATHTVSLSGVVHIMILAMATHVCLRGR